MRFHLIYYIYFFISTLILYDRFDRYVLGDPSLAQISGEMPCLSSQMILFLSWLQELCCSTLHFNILQKSPLGFRSVGQVIVVAYSSLNLMHDCCWVFGISSLLMLFSCFYKVSQCGFLLVQAVLYHVDPFCVKGNRPRLRKWCSQDLL